MVCLYFVKTYQKLPGEIASKQEEEEDLYEAPDLTGGQVETHKPPPVKKTKVVKIA